jgi:hypothetical protein
MFLIERPATKVLPLDGGRCGESRPEHGRGRDYGHRQTEGEQKWVARSDTESGRLDIGALELAHWPLWPMQ